MSNIRYTTRDFDSIREQLVSAIPTKTSRWTDFSPSDPGMVLLELWAAIGDQLGYYLDTQANEAFLPTARQRKNVINLCKLIAYTLENVVSATTQLEFTLVGVHPYRIDIPKWTTVSTNVNGEVVYFSTTMFASIPAGDTSVLVGAREGVIKEETFTTIGVEYQRFRLLEAAADITSIEVTIDDVLWEPATSFVNAQSTDRVYIVEVDENRNVDVVLGDGLFGLLPEASGVPNVRIKYLVSSGAGGNLGSGVLNTIQSTISDVLGNTAISISVTNPQAATGGADEETIEEAKRQAPAELSALFRAMTKADHIALLEGMPGVAKANAWGEQDEDPPDYKLFNWVLITAAPDGVTRDALVEDLANGALSDQLKYDILQFLEDRKCITTRLKIVDPEYVPIDIAATVYYTAGSLASNVKANVEEALFDFFEFGNVKFGKEIRVSNVYRTIDLTPGVSYVSLTGMATDGSPDAVEHVIQLNRNQLPFLRNLTITMERDLDVPVRAGFYPRPGEEPAPLGD